MKHVPLSTLENAIIKPGFEEHLKPLLRYKGNQNLGRIHRMWNLFISGMEHEATCSDITQRLSSNPDYSKLCGPENSVMAASLYSFAGRLLDNPDVLAEERHLKEYIQWAIPPYKIFHLTPIPNAPDDLRALAKGKSANWAAEYFGVDYRTARRWFGELGIESVHRSRIEVPSAWQSYAAKETNLELARRFSVCNHTVARWRGETGIVCLAPRKHVVSAGTLIYPFAIHDGGKPEHHLLRKVNAAVPKYFDPETRADICQDLVVGILCGDFSEDDLTLPAKEMTRRVQQMFPTKYGPLSLDAEIPGTDGFRLIDTISEEDSLWART